MNHDEATATLMEIVAAWPNPPMPTIVMEAWAETIEPLDYHAARNALIGLIKTHQFRPTPAELEDAARPLSPLRLVPAFVPEIVEGVLPVEEQKARISELRSTLKASVKHIDDLDEPGRPA